MDLLFSFLYLENYRSIKKRAVSFDHRYQYDPVQKTIKGNADREHLFGSGFYGKNVYSVTCLVGKNGEGKTSLVDFLRDSFVLIKRDLEKGTFKQGSVEIPEGKADYYHLDRDTNFLVVFRKNEKDFYVTNIKEVKTDDKLAEQCMRYSPDHYTGEPDYRIAYYSMMRFAYKVCEQEKFYGRAGQKKSLGTGEKADSLEEILGRYNIDFSEEEMNQLKAESRPPVTSSINMDLLMQLAFLDSGEEMLESILGTGYRTRLEISGVNIEGTLEETIIKFSDIADIKKGELKSKTEDDPAKRNLLVTILSDISTAYLRPFSSGQYSRFAFLARLYWYMGGGEKFWDTPLMKGIRDREERQKVIKSKAKWLETARFNDDSGILLIDEGELYYHPEWQRCFVSDVFRLIGKYGGSANVQVVFTTSSTFMLSDILREDVVVLSEANPEKLPYLEEDLQTFGQNIHMLLANRFFMDSSIGAGSERVIKELFKLLRAPEDEKDKNEDPEQRRKRVQDGIRAYFENYVAAHPDEFSTPDKVDDFICRLIKSIGEEFYRRQLLEMFEEYKRYTRRLSEKLEMARQILAEIKQPDETTQKALELLTEIQKEGSL